MFAFVFILMSIMRPSIFLRSWNIVSMMKQFPEYGLMAIGISLAMITGGIDLAVVGTANLTAIITARFLIAMVPKGSPNSVVIPKLIAGVFIAVATGVCCRTDKWNFDKSISHSTYSGHTWNTAVFYWYRDCYYSR